MSSKKNDGKFDCIYDTATGNGHGENYVSYMAMLLRDETGEYVQINGGMATLMRYYTGTMKPQQNFFLTSDENNQTDFVEITRLLKSTGVKPHIDLLKLLMQRAWLRDLNTSKEDAQRARLYSTWNDSELVESCCSCT